MINLYFFRISAFGTILTSVELNKQKGKKLFQLSKSELVRIENILKKAIDKETGKLKLNDKSLTEDNPDGRKCTFKTIFRLWKASRACNFVLFLYS